MYIPKRYGQSRIDKCPFCGKQAITQNGQKVPVCMAHAKRDLPLMRCMCGETMDMLNGKWGVFFSCMKHGNMNLRKALEVNPLSQEAQPPRTSLSATTKPGRMENNNEDGKRKKEITVRSDELEWVF